MIGLGPFGGRARGIFVGFGCDRRGVNRPRNGEIRSFRGGQPGAETDWRGVEAGEPPGEQAQEGSRGG
jgi:hypothetical protein